MLDTRGKIRYNFWREQLTRDICHTKGSHPQQYVSLLFEYETGRQDDLIGPGNAIAFDGPSDGLSTDLNGEFGLGYQFYCEREEQLAMEQRCLPRRRPDSHHCEKQRIQAAKGSRHIANQRRA